MSKIWPRVTRRCTGGNSLRHASTYLLRKMA